MIKAEGCSDRGRVRANNEDAFCISTELGLAAVADGMGGQLAGEVASRMAVNVLKDYLSRAASGGEALMGAVDDRFSKTANKLASGIRLANRVIYEASRSSAGWAGMGTTIVAVVLEGNHASIAHVGDSRVYHVNRGGIRPLTEDHSLVAEQVRRGLLTREAADASTQRNIITRALGQDPEVAVDLAEITLIGGDYLLLCSDGLTTMVPDEEIHATIIATDDLEASCAALVARANEAGGKDNITVALVQPDTGGLFGGIRNLFRRER